MITTITFNPSIDRMYRVSSMNIGEVQRVVSAKATAGGKGINVTKVCKILQEEPLAMGFLGGYNGEFIKEELRKLDIKNKFTKINQETRNCLNIITDDKVSTEFLEKGPILEDGDLEKFENDIKEVMKSTKILVASGSYCQNIPLDYYEKIGNLCRENNVKFILDTSGEALKVALKSKPYLIKPNTDEIKQLLNIDIESRDEVISAGKKLIEMGAENVCISLGKDGMIYLNAEEVYEAKVPKIEAVNTVGSGDSTIAGFSVGILRGYEIEELLKLSNACGISNALNIETGFVILEEVEKYKDLVKVTKLS
ncbi:MULTISPECIES: 1-phosphofructokinase [Terrisporobacter]|uniref:Tagatose-6-phosphate kinase n=1 Tax=Terrisporobacter othiniensis TaxID=1577792 RepID=A0A0B3VNX0_9FIRM|nr:MULTISPECIES: 1-phosphofructokinase [Terrisporobacter]KHS58496.1 sugar kinase [Terrisporobacter othiniensis]MCC3669138.1 1-phosphofructokinase [Terrisporobacter mayombei]